MAWLLKAEYDLIISSLTENLGLAKYQKFIYYSIDVRRCILNDIEFSTCLESGKNYTSEALQANIKDVCKLNNKNLIAVIWACCVDSVNLAHVFNLLRIEEILECLYTRLSISLCAIILIAVIGEIHLTIQNLSLNATYDPSKEFVINNVTFLKLLLNDLIALIIECGRDRTTHLKESVLMLSSTSYPNNHEFINGIFDYSKESVNEIDKNNFKDKYLISIYSIYEKGDLQLERLLQCGSLASIWLRLHQIATSSLTKETSKALIKWSIIKQIPKLNKCRQLIFTRLLQCLCLPVWNGLYNINRTNSHYFEKSSNNSYITKIVHKSFVSCGIMVWCYEDERQKFDILKSDIIPSSLAKAVIATFKLKIDRYFLEICMTNELPSLDHLEQLFSDWKPYRKTCEDLKMMDENECRKMPLQCQNGKMKHEFIGSRFHRAAPEFGISEETRFFTNPIITALLDKQKFADTVNEFLHLRHDSN